MNEINKTITSFQVSEEMNEAINRAVENRFYRSKSDMMREGIKMAIEVAKNKEQMMNRSIEQDLKIAQK